MAHTTQYVMIITILNETILNKFDVELYKLCRDKFDVIINRMYLYLLYNIAW